MAPPAKKAAKTAAKTTARKAPARPAKSAATAPAAEPAAEGWEEAPAFATPPAPRLAPPPAPTAAPAAWTAAPGGRAPMRADEERQYALFLHLSALAGFLTGGLGFVLGPLIMWLIKKDDSPFVDRHGRAAVDFWISVLIYVVGAFVLFMVVAVATLGIGVLLLIPLLFVGGIALFVLALLLPILAGLKAQRGEEHRYPLSFRFLGHPPQQAPPGTTLI
jgi:uncharacterized Tic20 family protein